MSKNFTSIVILFCCITFAYQSIANAQPNRFRRTKQRTVFVPTPKVTNKTDSTANSITGKTNKLKSKESEEYIWQPLFDGKTLEGWTRPEYGGDGDVTVKDGVIKIEAGASMTGIKYEKLVPTTDYEIRYQARRTMGGDFFAALTFPVGESFCTFINGGWGGSAIGLSSIDGLDASENETNDYKSFKDKTWYEFRVRVTGKWITCYQREQDKEGGWQKEERIINVNITDKKIGLRMETDLYKPLAICTWVTASELKNIEMRKLKPEEVEEDLKREE
ncbi:MAG: DUF1080 domain-containing protein [Planctomycetaceae bacterium]|jgi:hypothetical protein|nr:DUF1080 domain-containing protein [Planctomycetaceae bacterium]